MLGIRQKLEEIPVLQGPIATASSGPVLPLLMLVNQSKVFFDRKKSVRLSDVAENIIS